MSIANLFSDDGNIIPIETNTWNALSLSEGFQPNTVALADSNGYLGSINNMSTTLNAPEILFNSNSVKVVPDDDNVNVFQVVNQNGDNILNASNDSETNGQSVTIGKATIVITGAEGSITDTQLLNTNTPTFSGLTPGEVVVALSSSTIGTDDQDEVNPSVNISKNLTVSNSDVNVMEILPGGQAFFNVSGQSGFQINDQSQNTLFNATPTYGVIQQASTVVTPFESTPDNIGPFTVYDKSGHVIFDMIIPDETIRSRYTLIPMYGGIDIGTPDSDSRWGNIYATNVQIGVANASVLGTDSSGNIIQMSTTDDINFLKQQMESLSEQVNTMAQELTRLKSRKGI